MPFTLCLSHHPIFQSAETLCVYALIYSCNLWQLGGAREAGHEHLPSLHQGHLPFRRQMQIQPRSCRLPEHQVCRPAGPLSLHCIPRVPLW